MNLSENELYYLMQAVNKRSIFKTKQEIEFIDYTLKDVPFFKDMRKQLGDASYYQMLKELQYECHMPYEPQVQIGDQSNKFYFIIQGKFLILTKSILSNSDLYISPEVQQILNKKFSELQPQSYLYAGQYFGEQVMMFDQSHTQTILPLEKSRLLVIKRDVYRRILEFRTKKDDARRFSFLSQVPLFNKWSAKTLRILIPEIQEVNFIQNSLIYQQGDVVDAVYVIIEGEVQISRSINKNSLPTQILGIKESFGDDEILNQYRTTTAKSLSNLKLFRINKVKFLEHIPFNYSNIEYQEQQQQSVYQSKQLKKLLSLKPNPTMYLTPFKQSDQHLRFSRSESMSQLGMSLKSPLLRTQVLQKKKQQNQTLSHMGFSQVNDMLRKNYHKLDQLIQNEHQISRKQNCSQSPSRRQLRLSFSPNQYYEEIHNENHSRIHGGKCDKNTYLQSQMKLRSITQCTWNKYRNDK